MRQLIKQCNPKQRITRNQNNQELAPMTNRNKNKKQQYKQNHEVTHQANFQPKINKKIANTIEKEREEKQENERIIGDIFSLFNQDLTPTDRQKDTAHNTTQIQHDKRRMIHIQTLSKIQTHTQNNTVTNPCT